MALLNRCSYKVCDRICHRLKIPVKERAILLDGRLKTEKQLYVIENTDQYSCQDLYWALIHFKPEYILYMMALAKDETTRKAISNFYTHQREIKPFLRGRDLLDLGMTPGPVFTVLFKEILNAKLSGKLKTKKEELAFAKDYAVSNNLID